MKKISKLFLSSLQFMKTRKNFKVQSAKCLVVEFRKFWKYSKSRQEVTIQDGCFEKNSKLKLKYGWIKFRKSKSSLDWLWYFQSFLENIIEHTIIHSWIYTRIWEENLDLRFSIQIQFNMQMFKLKLRYYVQMYKFKHKYNQVLYASHV